MHIEHQRLGAADIDGEGIVRRTLEAHATAVRRRAERLGVVAAVDLDRVDAVAAVDLRRRESSDQLVEDDAIAAALAQHLDERGIVELWRAALDRDGAVIDEN